MARGNPLINEEDLKKGKSRFDPNLRDEGAGFFSTLFTAGSNIGSDAVTELGYIAQAVARPIDTGEAVLRVLAGYAQKALPNDWEAYLPEDWATNKVYANAINDYYAEKYGSLEQAADSFAEQPISVALDAFAVKALLTTISRQAAKRSAATTKMAKTAKGTVMEGELASRAAAELKVAQELERTVKYEGKLVWDDALGAYVPESSVTKPAKIDAAEVAPVVAAIEDAVPNNNPAVANVADDSSLVGAQVTNPEGMRVLVEAAKEAKKIERTLDDSYQDIYNANGPEAAEAFYLSEVVPAKVAIIDAEIAIDNAMIANAAAEGRNATGSLRAVRENNIRKIALEQDIKYSEATGVYNATLTLDELAAQTELYPIHDAATQARIIKQTGSTPESIAQNQKKAQAVHDAYKARAAEETANVKSLDMDADGMMAATRTQEVAPALADDAARISDEAFAEDYRKYIEERANQPLDDFEGVGAYITEDFPSKTGGVEFGASLAKQRADNLRKADDAAMAAAIQDDLFTNASPAAYENYQASRLAALADDTALATAAPKGMITSRAAGPISRTKDIDIPSPPSVPKLTAKPESASRGFKDLEINPSRVLPAAQRVAAAASQTGLQGERGTDGSFLPKLPDRGIDIDQSIGASIPESAPVEIIKSSEKPGWYQGVTKEDDDDGNYWSADFEDEHWNTPAGVQEAIGIWGRPVGNRIGQRFN